MEPNDTGIYEVSKEVKKNLYKKEGRTGGRKLSEKELKIQKEIREEVFKNLEDEIKNLREIVTLLIGSASIFYDWLFVYKQTMPEGEEGEAFKRKLAFLDKASELYKELTFTTDIKAQELGTEYIRDLLEKQAKLTPIVTNYTKGVKNGNDS